MDGISRFLSIRISPLEFHGIFVGFVGSGLFGELHNHALDTAARQKIPRIEYVRFYIFGLVGRTEKSRAAGHVPLCKAHTAPTLARGSHAAAVDLEEIRGRRGIIKIVYGRTAKKDSRPARRSHPIHLHVDREGIPRLVERHLLQGNIGAPCIDSVHTERGIFYFLSDSVRRRPCVGIELFPVEIVRHFQRLDIRRSSAVGMLRAEGKGGRNDSSCHRQR